MTKKLLSNISLKLMSVIVGIVVWLLVVNVDDPIVSDTIPGVTVTIKNESYVFRASGYAWQSEYRHRRVVRMNTHIDAVLVAYRHYCLQEIYEVGAECATGAVSFSEMLPLTNPCVLTISESTRACLAASSMVLSRASTLCRMCSG